MNMNGTVIAIYICPLPGETMQRMDQVEAITGQGLRGDRYCTGEGSHNRGQQGKRQVTLINEKFFAVSGFEWNESRRNIITKDVELNKLLPGHEFRIGNVRFRAVKYCDPCSRPSLLLGVKKSFKQAFFDCGGIIAEVLEGGIIEVGDSITSDLKDYE